MVKRLRITIQVQTIPAHTNGLTSPFSASAPVETIGIPVVLKRTPGRFHVNE